MESVVIKKITDAYIQEHKIYQWPVWEKEVSKFGWEYTEDEECLILEGEFTVETDEGTYEIKAGDFVTFKKGLTCVWDVKKSVRKHYHFK